MDGEDGRVQHDILGRGAGFGHRQHIELAWRYLALHDPDRARSEWVAPDLHALPVLADC